MEEIDTTELRRHAIESFVFRFAVPIIYESPERAAVLGTGTLFRARDRFFLISAAHVLEKLLKPGGGDRIGVPADHERGEVLTVAKGHLASTETSKIDVGVLEFQDELVVERLVSGWSFLTPDSISASYRRYACYFIVGYPSVLAKSQSVVVVGRPIGVIGAPYDGPVHEGGEPFDRNVDLLVDFPDALGEIPVETTEIPRLQGMSGAPVWTVLADRGEETVWSPSLQVRIVGVMTNVSHGHYIRAKQWHLVYRVFEQIDPTIAHEIQERLEAY